MAQTLLRLPVMKGLSLAGFRVCLSGGLAILTSTVGAAPGDFSFSAPPAQIGLPIPSSGTGGAPDSSLNVTRSTVVVSGVGPSELIQDLNVMVNLDHESVSDLVIDLISPEGLIHRLSNRRGSGGPGYHGTVFDDEATTRIADGQPPFTGAFRPEGPLGSVRGMIPNGTGTLVIEDRGFGVAGVLTGWSLVGIAATAALPELSIQDAVRVEGDTGNSPMVFTLRLSASTTIPVSCQFATGNGTAHAGSDYVPTTGSAEVQPGETLQAITIPIVGDGVLESDEMFSVQLTDVAGATVLDGRASGLILNDDPDAEIVQQAAPPAQINLRIPPLGEGATGDPAWDITRSELQVSGLPPAAEVLAVAVTFSAEHTWMQDMVLRLISPNGSSVLLAENRGGEGTNYVGTVFDDHSSISIGEGQPPFTGPHRPEDPLSHLVGEPANGTWALEIEDNGFGDIGWLLGWSLNLTALERTAVILPRLWVQQVEDQVILTWPAEAADYVLEIQGELGLEPWQEVSMTPDLIGANLTVTWPLSTEPQFFRLRR
jgi:subtilisin-like proprotein convertase family protein